MAPVLRAQVLPGSSTFLALSALVAVVIASTLLERIADRRWPMRLAIVAAAVTLLFAQQGALIGLLVLAGLLVADWGIRRRRTVPFLAVPDRTAAAPITVLALVAAYQATHRTATVAPLIPFAIAGVVTAGAAWGGPLHRAFGRLGKALATGAGALAGFLAFGFLGVAIVIIPWTFQRLLRIDPLRTGSGPTGWRNRFRRDTRANSPWTAEAVRETRSPWLRVRESLPAFALVLIAVPIYRATSTGEAAAPVLFGSSHQARFDESYDVPAAMEGVPWYQTLSQDTRWITDDRVAWNLLDQYRFDDVSTEHMNVRNGHRVSWEPEASDNPELTIWMYGGSTTFGMNQRDEHTIASYLAKTARADGIDLTVVNRGVNGQGHFLEANRFAWDLAVEEHPDLAIFYDGFNDVWTGRQLETLGFGNRREPLDPMIADLSEQLEERAGRSPAPPNGGEVLAQPTTRTDDPARIAELTIGHYEKSRQMSAASGEANDVPVRYFWQPWRFTRDVPHPLEPAGESSAERADRDQAAATLAILPSDVTDLTDLFDDVEDPIYTDECHHNELGARLVAEALYESIRSDLEALV